MKCTQPCFKMDYNDLDSYDVKFLRDLYDLMKKYNVHRIYSATIDKKKIISAEQLLGGTIGNNRFTSKVFTFLDQNIPWLYFNIFHKNHLFRYNVRLKWLFRKHGIEKITISSFNLYQGIHVTTNSLCVREVDIVYKNGCTFHIENLHLDIKD